jgi:hypothetical protein
MPTPKDGFTPVGFEFGCDWDEEHGFGVLTHAGHVLEWGAADTAFSDYFWDIDGEQRLRNAAAIEKAAERRNEVRPGKSWWQLWK